MFAQRLFQNFFWIIGIKFPIEGNWINVVPPAENALVGARDIGRVLHTLVRRNAVEGVFVAAPLPWSIDLVQRQSFVAEWLPVPRQG